MSQKNCRKLPNLLDFTCYTSAALRWSWEWRFRDSTRTLGDLRRIYGSSFNSFVLEQITSTSPMVGALVVSTCPIWKQVGPPLSQSYDWKSSKYEQDHHPFIFLAAESTSFAHVGMLNSSCSSLKSPNCLIPTFGLNYRAAPPKFDGLDPTFQLDRPFEATKQKYQIGDEIYTWV